MRESQKIEPIALTEKEAAAYLGVSVQFLRQCRHYGHRPGRAQGPPYVHMGGGRSIRYLVPDLDQWLYDHRHDPALVPRGY